MQAYRVEPQFKKAVLQCEQERRGLTKIWAATHQRFWLLQEFCSGLATAFPNTTTVENDESIIGWEKDESRLDLTDFSLEVILRGKSLGNFKPLSVTQK